MLRCVHCGVKLKESEAALVEARPKWTVWRCPRCKGRNGMYTGLLNPLDHLRKKLREV